MPQSVDPQGAAAPDATQPETAPLITSRFLFVDVAAQRAKQLRRGALPRIEHQSGGPYKLERIAMEEVRTGAIHYTLPTTDSRGAARPAEPGTSHSRPA